MKLSPQRTTEIKTILFHGDDDKQKAEITIQFINDEGLKNTGYWEFVRCKFETETIPYSESDWDFLEAISNKIKELTK
jgi:hypothetical protein